MVPLREELSDDEAFAMVVSILLGTLGAVLWYLRALRTSRVGASNPGRALLLVAPPLALAFLAAVLADFAAVEVRTDGRYQFLFAAMGASWTFLLPRTLAFVGVSFRDDALERRNGAAAVAIGGAVAGLVLVFAGSNMGEGPSIWNTVFSAVAATSVLVVLVYGLARTSRFGDSIAIERDVASGVRAAGLFLGAGLVLGRATAGDWESVGGTLGDLAALGWPVLVLFALAHALERALRPSVSNPRPSLVAAGVLPAVLYVALSLLHVALLPDWRGNG